MVDTYSPNLALTLQETGTNSGTWGTITNTNLGTLIEQAISGYVTQAITDGAATVITIPNGTTGVARNMTLELTGALTAARVLEVPSNKKLYFIYNNTTGGYAVTVKVSGQTGVSVPNGKKMILVSNGTDIVEAVNYAGTISGGSLTLTGNLSVGGTSGFTGVATFTAQPIMSSLTASQAVFTDGSKGLVSNAITGTGNVVMSNSPTLVTPALGTPSSCVVTNFTGTASININGTVGATTPTTGAFTTLSASSSVTFSGGTANGVVYLNGSKVATSGSALTFDGTKLTQTANSSELYLAGGGSAAQGGFLGISRGGVNKIFIGTASTVIGGGSNTSDDLSLFATADTRFYSSSSEQMRLTSTGLGIGTTSPGDKLEVSGSGSAGIRVSRSGASSQYVTISSGSTGPTINASSGVGALTLGINSSTMAYLDASGNLGLGVTPSAWGSGYKAIQNLKSAWFGTSSRDANFGTNVYVDAGGYKYIDSSYSTNYTQYNGQHQWYTSGTTPGVANATITFTQAMTLDASGNLMLGATTASGALYIQNSTNAALRMGYGGANALNELAWDSGDFVISADRANAVASNLIFKNDGTERMRLDSSGNLGIGTTSPTAIGSSKVVEIGASSGNSAFQLFSVAGAIKGTIYGSSTEVSVGSVAAIPLLFKTSDTEKMRLDASGNLGVGLTANANTKIDANGPIRAKGYTVATLPTGVVGARAYVTDAVTAVFQAIPTGGGSVTTPVFYNGSNWVCG